MVPVAFEGEHRVHQVLQHLGSGQGAVLGDVAHQHQRRAGALGPPGQQGRAAAHLAHRARGGFELRVEQGLDGIHQEQGRLHGLGGLQDAPHIGLGEQVDGRVLRAQAPGPQLDLAFTLLAAGVEHGARAGRGPLQHQGGFADARLAAQQHHHPRNHPAAQHPVQFQQPGGAAVLVGDRHVGQRHRILVAALGEGAAGPGQVLAAHPADLLDGAEAPAGSAFPHGLRRPGAAGGAFEDGGALGHGSTLPRIQDGVSAYAPGPRLCTHGEDRGPEAKPIRYGGQLWGVKTKNPSKRPGPGIPGKAFRDGFVRITSECTYQIRFGEVGFAVVENLADIPLRPALNPLTIEDSHAVPTYIIESY